MHSSVPNQLTTWQHVTKEEQPLEESEVRSVLIADDDEAMRETLALQFEVEGFDVVAVSDGQELIDALRDIEPPYAVVTDVHMPKLTGTEALKRLREDGVNLPPVFIITSFPERVTRDFIATLGVAQVFEKPFDLDELTDAVTALDAQ